MPDTSELLSGVVGALVVFVLTVLWAESREARRRARACIGYARLLVTEINANFRALRGLPTPATWEDLREAQEELEHAHAEEIRSLRMRICDLEPQYRGVGEGAGG